MAHLLLDGYNLIRSSPSLSRIEARDFEAGRRTLIARLAHYKNVTGHKITVVFDAMFTDNLSIEEARVTGINVVFSKGGQTADEIIIEMVHQKRGEWIVVSSDREILQAAKACGCGILKAEDFSRKLNDVGANDTVRSPSLQRKQSLFMGWGYLPLHEEKWIEEKKPVHKRWITKKKGPSKRLPKAKRRALARLGEI